MIALRKIPFVPLGLHVVAVTMLVAILWANIRFWPIPFLGYNADLETGTVITIDAGSAAARAGLRAGDQIVAVYHQPWDVVTTSWDVLAFIPNPAQLIPVSVLRDNTPYDLWLVQDSPQPSFQMQKAINIVLALLCWSVGYVLGVVRRVEAASYVRVACFWLLLSGIVGVYLFALYASPPLQLFLEWAMIAVILPFAMYIHLWFPRRFVASRSTTWAGWIGAGYSVLITVLLVSVVALAQLSVVQVLTMLGDVATCVPMVSLLGSSIILWKAYRGTSIGHVRRQIRILGIACFLTAGGWLLGVLLPAFTDHIAFSSDQRLNALVGIIPSAYLLIGVPQELYHIDRVLRRMSVHMATVLFVVVMLVSMVTLLHVHGPVVVLWVAVSIVVLYRPIYQAVQSLLLFGHDDTRADVALQAMLTHLTTTLDATALHAMIIDGFRAAFGHPGIAFYQGDCNQSNQLQLVFQERLPHLPSLMMPGNLSACLGHTRHIVENSTLTTLLANQPLHEAEMQALLQPGVTLWCPICHAQGALLGVIVLGIRGDLDPYRPHDRTRIQHGLDAAALALTNSATYTAQRDAEHTIRQLYEQLETTQQDTARSIARELHDEIINVNVRLNIDALHQVLEHTHDLHMREALELVLASEHTTIQALRMVCEQLHPTSRDDPFGLAAALRAEVQHTRTRWNGTCAFTTTGVPYPLTGRVQHECVRIVREALTNTLTHAQATEVTVHVQYPTPTIAAIVLTISDNGTARDVIGPKAGHWGVRSMYERARLIGGAMHVLQTPGSGTTIHVQIETIMHEGKSGCGNNNQVQ